MTQNEKGKPTICAYTSNTNVTDHPKKILIILNPITELKEEEIYMTLTDNNTEISNTSNELVPILELKEEEEALEKKMRYLQ